MKSVDVQPGMEIEISRKGVVTRLTVDKIKKLPVYENVYAFFTHELGRVYVDETTTITLLSEAPDPQKFGMRAIVNGQRYLCVQAFDRITGRNSLWKCDDESAVFYSWYEMLDKGDVEFVKDEEHWFSMS